MTQDNFDFTDKRLDPRERPRLNKQCMKILTALYQSPGGVPNTELTKIALRYSARIGDMKKEAGIRIKIVNRCASSGVNLYAFASEFDRERAAGYINA